MRVKVALMGFLVASVFAVSLITVPVASAQSQPIAAIPGSVNLGMTTSIVVTAPSAGSYTAIVKQPNGTEATYTFDFASSGEVLNATYGNATSGFDAVVDQTGTYGVFLEQGSTVISSTAFYATNKLLVSMDMVNGGECAYIAGATRGTKMFPRFYIYFASDGVPMTNLDPGALVTYTLPDGTARNATWDRGAHLFVGKLQPSWNYTDVGAWNPSAVIRDAAGNEATFNYSGSPFVITPVQLDSSVQVTNSAGQVVTTLSDGVSATIEATITYPTNAEPVPGFLGPLDTARGGSVTAKVGWGFYNVTSGTFGGSAPGGLIGTVALTYTGSNGTWTGQFESNNLPTLPAGATYQVVVDSHDGASPSNTGFVSEVLTSGAASSAQSITTSVSTVTEAVETIPTVVYAALAMLLILGLIIGLIIRVPR